MKQVLVHCIGPSSIFMRIPQHSFYHRLICRPFWNNQLASAVWYLLSQSSAEWALILPSRHTLKTRGIYMHALARTLGKSMSRKLLHILTEKEPNSTNCGQITNENIQQSLTCLKRATLVWFFVCLGFVCFYHEILNINFYKGILNNQYIHFLQITAFFSRWIPRMQCNLPQFNLLVPWPTAVLLKFIWSSGMNSWYTVASIQILDMKTSLIIFTQTYHIALLRLTCVKTDCLLHRIYWVVMSLSDHIIYEKILLHNSSSQMKNCHFHMNTLVFLSSSQMRKKKRIILGPKTWAWNFCI